MMHPQIYRHFLLQHGGNTPLGRVTWSGYHCTDHTEFDGPMRPYGNYALVYLLEGEGHYVDALGMDRDVTVGDLILTFPDIPRRYGSATGHPWSELYIIFDGPVFDLWRAQGLLDPKQRVRHLEPVGYWRRRFEDVVCRRDASERYALERVCLLQQLLAEMDQFWREEGVGKEDREWLAQAYEVLDQEDASSPVDYAPFLAAQNMSYEGFRKRFTQLAGIAPGQYMAKSRIRRVCQLLERTDFKLHQIAEQCGFSDEFHLSKRFKQLVGMTPSDFRRRAPRARSRSAPQAG